MNSKPLSGHKILFSAPILPKAAGKADTDGYGYTNTGEADAIDWNGNGQLDAELYRYTSYWGKGGGAANGALGARATEPAILSPSLEQLKSYAKELGVAVLGAEHLPNGVFVGEAASDGMKNFRPIETLVYQATPTINPKAAWAIDTANDLFLVYEK